MPISWTGLLGDEDFTGHVESGYKQDISTNKNKKFEEEASAKMCLVAGRGELAFPETLYMWDAELGLQ